MKPWPWEYVFYTFLLPMTHPHTYSKRRGKSYLILSILGITKDSVRQGYVQRSLNRPHTALIIIIIKRISRAPIYHTKWEHRALYNNTNHTHTHDTHSVERGDGQGCKKKKRKKSLEIIIKQVHLEGGFERGGRIRVAECLRQIVPDRWASIRKRSFTKCFCVYMGGDKGSCVRCRS